MPFFPAAYSLAWLDWPWAGWMGIAIFFVYLVPPTLLLLSLSRIVVALGLGLQDSTWSLQAAAVLVLVPIALVFNLFLNRFIAGFTQGAVKG